RMPECVAQDDGSAVAGLLIRVLELTAHERRNLKRTKEVRIDLRHPHTLGLVSRGEVHALLVEHRHRRKRARLRADVEEVSVAGPKCLGWKLLEVRVGQVEIDEAA